MLRYRFYLLLALLYLLNVNFALYNLKYLPGSILGDEIVNANVDISASIPFCPTIWITPENRLPPTDNNSLEIAVDIRTINTSNVIYSTTVTTDNSGQAQVCNIPFNLITDPSYDVSLKGLSHLRRTFEDQPFTQNGVTFDLRTPVLFAGDSNPSSDNYVNVLDIAYEVLNIYNADLRADLNRDTVVNSLEFPTQISHFHTNGDP